MFRKVEVEAWQSQAGVANIATNKDFEYVILNSPITFEGILILWIGSKEYDDIKSRHINYEDSINTIRAVELQLDDALRNGKIHLYKERVAAGRPLYFRVPYNQGRLFSNTRYGEGDNLHKCFMFMTHTPNIPGIQSEPFYFDSEEILNTFPFLHEQRSNCSNVILHPDGPQAEVGTAKAEEILIGAEIIGQYRLTLDEIYQAYCDGSLVVCEGSPFNSPKIPRSDDKDEEFDIGFGILAKDEILNAPFIRRQVAAYLEKKISSALDEHGKLYQPVPAGPQAAPEPDQAEGGTDQLEGVEPSDPEFAAMPSVKRRVSSEGRDKSKVQRTCEENKEAYEYVQKILRQNPANPDAVYAALVRQIRAAGGSGAVAGCLIFPESKDIEAARQAAKYRLNR
jgi:hypothetical protein